MPASDLSHTVSIDAPTFEAGWEYSQDQDTNDWSASSMSSISIYDVSPAAPQILRPVVIKCSETIEKTQDYVSQTELTLIQELGNAKEEIRRLKEDNLALARFGVSMMASDEKAKAQIFDLEKAQEVVDLETKRAENQKYLQFRQEERCLAKLKRDAENDEAQRTLAQEKRDAENCEAQKALKRILILVEQLKHQAKRIEVCSHSSYRPEKNSYWTAKQAIDYHEKREQEILLNLLEAFRVDI